MPLQISIPTCSSPLFESSARSCSPSCSSADDNSSVFHANGDNSPIDDNIENVSLIDTPCSSPASSNADLPMFLPYSKREYLLAQIRQKDAIIESLLKQLHNPYIATPLSISRYKDATLPADQNKNNVLAWLDRLQASVLDAGGKAGPRAFKEARPPNSGFPEDPQDDSDPESKLTHAQRFGLVPVDDGVNGMAEGGDEDDEDGSSTGSIQDGGPALPDPSVPLGLIATLSLDNNPKVKSAKKGGKEDPLEEDDLDDDNVGVANVEYFKAGPSTDLNIRATLIEQHAPPEILVHGLVTPDDVDKLFEIFWTKLNPFVSLLDPVLHNPQTTFTRCPFLFTVICAVSSRYYSDKSEIYPIAMHFAKHSAANALIDGWKSVELCQAYILMSIYAVPARRWEEDRSWLYTGLAIRLATDLNLHQISGPKPQNERQAREQLNRIRVWQICFNLDRSTATQFGKPSTIKDDYIVRHSKEWYKKSPYNLYYDVHFCAHTDLLRIVAKFHDAVFSDPKTPSGLNRNVDFRTITMHHDAQLTLFTEEWTKRFDEAAEGHKDDHGGNFRRLLLPFLVAYSRLVMYSFGFQQSYKRGVESGDNFFFSNCLESAKTVIRCMIDDLAPSGYMRYAPDGHFVFVSFASAFLLKLLRPEFTHLLSREEETDIFDLIGRLIQTISSPVIAIDDRHTPKLYARFLAGLLSKHRRDGATIGRLQTHPAPQQPLGASPVGGGGALGMQDHLSGNGMPSIHVSFPMEGGGSTPLQDYDTPQDLPPSYQHSVWTTQPMSIGEKVAPTPIYRPEATFVPSGGGGGGAGTIQFGGGDIEMFGFGGGIGMDADGEMLATMQALKNPNWWNNMMMPGFSWPDPGSPASNTSASSVSSPGYSYATAPLSATVPPASMPYGMYSTSNMQ